MQWQALRAGLDPLTDRAYYETRAAVGAGLFCVACGAASGVLGDALLPQSTQAPLAALATAVRAALDIASERSFEPEARELMSRDDGALLEGERPATTFGEESSEASFDFVDATQSRSSSQRRLWAILLMVCGPALALTGARLDDQGGWSVTQLAAQARSPAAVFAAAASLIAALAMPASGFVAAVVKSALSSAWAHAAVKALVELVLFYRARCLRLVAAWFAMVTVPALVALKLRAVARGLDSWPAPLFVPIYQALAVAANAGCGILVYDDFGYFESVPNLKLPSPRRTVVYVLVYGVGLACTVSGILLAAEVCSDPPHTLKIDTICSRPAGKHSSSQPEFKGKHVSSQDEFKAGPTEEANASLVIGDIFASSESVSYNPFLDQSPQGPPCIHYNSGEAAKHSDSLPSGMPTLTNPISTDTLPALGDSWDSAAAAAARSATPVFARLPKADSSAESSIL